MFKKKALTLVETLVVIAIIIVVAAIDLPSINSICQKKKFEQELKEDYHKLQVALDKYNSIAHKKIKSADAIKVKEGLKLYLDVAYEGLPQIGQMYKIYSSYNDIKYTDDMKYVFDDYGYLVLQNDTTIMFGYTNKNKVKDSVGIWIDVNGHLEGPNIMGVDLYGLMLDKDGNLIPMGANGTGYSGGEYCYPLDNSMSSGMGCAYKVLKNEKLHLSK